MGKTALLEYAGASGRQGAGWRASRACSPRWSWRSPGCTSCARRCSTGSSGLPEPQRDALGEAFGLSAGAAPDRFLVGLAVLSLLSEVADERPLVCLIDDAQWLDRASAQALAFVARRLVAESVGVVFAVREPSARPELAGLPELEVGGLRDADARALLASACRGRWTSGCEIGSWPRRAAIRWRCWSCRKG